MCVVTTTIAVLIDFLDLNYRYKYVATNISRQADWATVR